MQCDIVLGRDTVRLLNNHLQTTSVSQNRRKWERGLANSNNTRREAEVVQGAITSLHANFVKRAEQTDSIRQLVIASPYPVLACGDFTPCHPPTPMPNCPMSSKTASAPAVAAICTPTATSNTCCAVESACSANSPGKPLSQNESVFEPSVQLSRGSPADGLGDHRPECITKLEISLGACAILTAYIPMYLQLAADVVIRGIHSMRSIFSTSSASYGRRCTWWCSAPHAQRGELCQAAAGG